MSTPTQRPTSTSPRFGVPLTFLLLLAGAGARGAQPTGKAARATCPKGMALIPEGRYVMGHATSDGVAKAEAPRLVQAFCLDVTEVRVADASAFWATPRQKTDPMMDQGTCHAETADHAALAVNCVDWHQASAFCAAKGKRLPTDAEWEWAARGADKGWKFPWGDAAPWEDDDVSLGLCWRQPRDAPGCRAGSSEQDVSPQGVRDLYGSVTEWTSSPHPKRDTWRRARGACATCTAHATVTERLTYEVTLASSHLGFRCASSPAAGGARGGR